MSMSSAESTASTSSVENCKCCEERIKQAECDSTLCSHEVKSKKTNSLSSLAQNLRRGRSLNFTNKRVRKNGRPSKEIVSSPTTTSTSKTKWVMKFNCTKKERKCSAEDNKDMKCCVCTCYRRTNEHHLGAGVVFQTNESAATQLEEEGSSDVNTSQEVKDSPSSSSSTTTSPSSPNTIASASTSTSPSTSASVDPIEAPNSPPIIEVYGNIVGPNSTSIILSSSLIDKSR